MTTKLKPVEETTTPEVEGIEEVEAIVEVHMKLVPYLDQPEEFQKVLREAFHHQLQKAREDTIHRILAIVSSKQNQFTSAYELGYQDCVKNILESIHHYQSQLDEPHK